MNKIATCLWFDDQAEAAATLYTSVFKTFGDLKIAKYGKSGAKMSGQKEGAVMLVDFQIENLELQALNAGPIFQFTPALSFSVACITPEEIEEKWQQLSEGGKIRMPLQEYPWSPKYGWTEDRFGVGWQLNLVPTPTENKIAPSFLFTDELFGKGEEALNYYTSILPSSKVDQLVRDDKTGSIMYAAFTLCGQSFNLMEGQGKHGHKFTNATSIVVRCDSQEEIDKYWNELSAGGSIEECGWLKDKYGVSWQIVPKFIDEAMTDPVKSEKWMAAMTGMKKLDIEKLKNSIRN